MVVKIFKYWDGLDLLRQTPMSEGIWRGIKFEVGRSGSCDYAIIHGHAAGLNLVICPPENVWLILGEPPNETFQKWQEVPSWIDRVFTTDSTVTSSLYTIGPPCLPWHVNKDYDFLKSCPPMAKTAQLSWITSNRSDTDGHRLRMDYLRKIRSHENLDIFGRGFKPIGDKWDGLAPYRYSIAFENFSNSQYFTEKIMDCFLSWTMPIYYGCSAIEEFFPSDSFVRLNPASQDPIAELDEIIRSDIRERNLDAISQARDLVLNKYNFFELVASEIEKDVSNKKRKQIILRDHTASSFQILKNIIRPILRKQ